MSSLAPLPRYLEIKSCLHSSLSFVAHLYTASVKFNDIFRHAQAQSRALAGGFGGKKRVEDFGQLIGRDADAGIPDLNDLPLRPP